MIFRPETKLYAHEVIREGGQDVMYINYLGYRETSIWATVEEPILKANGLKINYIDVTPWTW